MKWKLLSSQIVFDNFTQIEERTYELPDKSIKKFYVKVNRPAACIVALTSDKQFILVEQFRPGPGQVFQELPGGYIDEHESPTEAAARELREETGYTGQLQFVTDCYDDAYTTMKRSCFVATNCKKTTVQELDSGEFINVKLLGLDDFLKLVRSGRMTDVEVAMLGLDYLGLLKSAKTSGL